MVTQQWPRDDRQHLGRPEPVMLALLCPARREFLPVAGCHGFLLLATMTLYLLTLLPTMATWPFVHKAPARRVRAVTPFPRTTAVRLGCFQDPHWAPNSSLRVTELLLTRQCWVAVMSPRDRRPYD